MSELISVLMFIRSDKSMREHTFHHHLDLDLGHVVTRKIFPDIEADFVVTAVEFVLQRIHEVQMIQYITLEECAPNSEVAAPFK